MCNPSIKNTSTLVFISLLFTALCQPLPTFGIEGHREILKRADQARGNLQGVTWTLTANSTEEGVTPLTLLVKARGFDLLGENLAPPKYKGNKILMVNGNMWFYRPGLSKPVPISFRQKLMGNASYGDIASTNYADDYHAKRQEDDTVEGEPCYVFNLTAKHKKATYKKIVYWISKGRGVGVKAEYYTVSGKIFKTARMVYEHNVVIHGQTRPFISRIRIFDRLLSKKVTTLAFTEPAIKPLPAHLFNLNLLRK